MSLWVKIRPLSWTLHVGLTTVQRYHAACEICLMSEDISLMQLLPVVTFLAGGTSSMTLL